MRQRGEVKRPNVCTDGDSVSWGCSLGLHLTLGLGHERRRDLDDLGRAQLGLLRHGQSTAVVFDGPLLLLRLLPRAGVATLVRSPATVNLPTPGV